MFGINGIELFLILLFGFLIFGPDKLPEIAKTVGKALAKFKAAQEEMNKVIKTEVYDPGSDEPFKNPLDALAKMGQGSKEDEKQESFSARKARYDKERAAKKAAESKKAEGISSVGAARASTAAAKSSTKETAVAQTKANPAQTKANPAQTKAATAQSKASEPKKKPTADELFGTKVVAKKPADQNTAQSAGLAAPVAKTSTTKCAASGTTAAAKKTLVPKASATAAKSTVGKSTTATRPAAKKPTAAKATRARTKPASSAKKVIEAVDNKPASPEEKGE